MFLANLFKPMGLVEEHIRRGLNNYFIPLFLVLFCIITISSLIKLATLTSIISIDAGEFFYLYFLSIDEVIFFSLNATFAISMCLSLSKLSSEYELITLSSFGFSPLGVIKIIFPIALLVSVFSILLSLGVSPKLEQLKDSFLNKKKQSASFNIKEGEYGQRFGDWIVYANSKEGNDYKDIILLSNEDNVIILILASSAFIENNGGILRLNLQKGRIIKTANDIKQINFEYMVLSNILPPSKRIDNLNDIVYYWANKGGFRSSKFLWYIAISAFPLLSLFFYLSIGYFNPRNGANYSTFFAISILVVYVILADRATATSYIHCLLLLFMWPISGYLWFYFAKRPYY